MYENNRQHKTQTQGSTKKGNGKSSIESQKGINAAQRCSIRPEGC